MVKAKVDVLRVESTCEVCGRKTISDGNSIIECGCGLKYRIESSVRIVTKKLGEKCNSF